MKINTSPTLERLIQSFVESGRFDSPAAVVEAAVAALELQESLRQAMQLGLQELDVGQGIEGDVVFQELREIANRTVAEQA